MGSVSMQPLLRFFLSEQACSLGVKLGIPREGDAGFDLASLETFSLDPGESQLVSTGVHFAIPNGWVGIVRDRSSMALRGGTTAAGVIDASYRGEVKVLLRNLGDNVLKIEIGERIAQCLFLPHLSGTDCQGVSSLESLGATERGAGGFGSTGR